MTTPSDVARGARLGGRYRLERRIAGGGMATVWLADDAELGRPVAIKVLSDVLATDPAYRQRFRREAKTAADLSHPNLVRIFDFGDGDRPYLVMEYVPGPTMARLIADAEPIAVDRLARELLAALAHIHRAGVVHRDVKPANILLGRSGEAKVTDFGIAQPEDATRITRTGDVIGTLRYMAPEVSRGAPATERSDLYSAGVVLAEAAGDEAPPNLGALIARLRATDPADRPPSADAALAELDDATVVTAPTAPIREPRSHLVPLWGALAGIVAIALAVIAVALATGGGGGSDTVRHPRGAAEAKQAHRRSTTNAPPTAATTSTAPAPAATTAPSPATKRPTEAKQTKERKPPKEGPPGIEKKPGGKPPGQLKKEAGGD